MNWTHEKPTEPGWYLTDACRLHLIRVRTDKNGTLTDGKIEIASYHEDWYWFGPIPAPPTEERNG